MEEQKTLLKIFSEEDIKSFEPEMKIGLLATINDAGLPHLTLITTMQASSPTEMFWGQFAEGMSKENIKNDPRTGFLIMTLDRHLWRGKARFTRTAHDGKEYELLNNIPLFRYNSYMGIHTVYYMDLIEQTGKEALPMGKIAQAAVKTIIARALTGKRSESQALNIYSKKLIDKIGNLKFLAYIGNDGYPLIIPSFQAQSAGSTSIIFSTSVYSEDIKNIPAGSNVALFCMSLEMQSVLLRGLYNGIRNIGGIPCGEIEINWIYSPMPPKAEQIYPPKKLEPISTFN